MASPHQPELELIHRPARGSKIQSAPLLFIHGAWHAAWCWDVYFLHYFAELGYDAYAVSLRGHGASEGKANLRWSGLKHFVTDVQHIVSQFDEKPILIGHSMGGAVVQKYLETSRARAAVLLASAPPSGVLGVTLKILRRTPFEFLKVHFQRDLFPVINNVEHAHHLLFAEQTDDKALAEYHSRLGSESYRVFLDMIGLNRPKPSAVMKNKLPILVLGAEKDHVFTVAEVRSTAFAYGTRAHIFKDMAHDVMLDPDWVLAASHIHHWIQSLESEPKVAAE